MYSPQLHTLTTRSSSELPPQAERVRTVVRIMARASIFFNGSFLQFQIKMFYLKAAGPWDQAWSRWAFRRSCRASRILTMASSTSTATNSSVDTALISGLTRFLVMP